MNRLSDTSSAAQRARLLDALCTGPVTTIEARRGLDILSPASRIKELRALGYQIETVWTVSYTEAGVKHRVGRYVLTGHAPIEETHHV